VLILRVVCASFYGNPCLKRNERYKLSCYLLAFFLGECQEVGSPS